MGPHRAAPGHIVHPDLGRLSAFRLSLCAKRALFARFVSLDACLNRTVRPSPDLRFRTFCQLLRFGLQQAQVAILSEIQNVGAFRIDIDKSEEVVAQ